MSKADCASGCGRLSYDEGGDQESFEWVDFRELTDQEVRQHPSYIVIQPRPPPAPRPPAAPASAAKAGSADPEQVGFLLASCCSAAVVLDPHLGVPTPRYTSLPLLTKTAS